MASASTIDLSLKGNPGMLLAFAARSLPLIGSILEEMAWNVFPDGAVQFEIDNIVISAYPTAIGSCSQALDLGYRRTGAFTITVGV